MAVAVLSDTSNHRPFLDSFMENIIPSASAQEMEDPMERMEEKKEEENDPNSQINVGFREQWERIRKLDQNYSEVHSEDYVYTQSDVENLKEHADQLEF